MMRSQQEYSRLEHLLTKSGREPFLTIEEMLAEEPGCPYCASVLREVTLESGAGLREVLECPRCGEIPEEMLQ